MNFSLLFKKRTFNRLVCLLISIITYSCIDPIEPIFDFQSDIVIINGLASTTPGSTSVKVEKTKIEFGDYVSEFILAGGARDPAARSERLRRARRGRPLTGPW